MTTIAYRSFTEPVHPSDEQILSVITAAVNARRSELVVAGELDLASATRLRRRLHEELAGGHDVDLDVAEVAFIDTAGVRALVECSAEFTAAGRQLRLRGPRPDQMRRLLAVMGALDGRSPPP